MKCLGTVSHDSFIPLSRVPRSSPLLGGDSRRGWDIPNMMWHQPIRAAAPCVGCVEGWCKNGKNCSLHVSFVCHPHATYPHKWPSCELRPATGVTGVGNPSTDQLVGFGGDPKIWGSPTPTYSRNNNIWIIILSSWAYCSNVCRVL